jgi:2-C-methyl-D-erythritol 4-phosphate cytidylyltransferase
LFIALIVAAGTGERMNSIIPKQFLPVLGKPVLAYTIDAFEKSPLIDEIIVVINENHEKQFQEQILNHIQTKKVLHYVFGGGTRQDSVYAGLELIFNRPDDYVLIHDGVRPLVSEDILMRSVEGVMKYGAVCCAIPSVDTLKISKNNNYIDSTLDRSVVWRAQTPQSFKISIIWEAIQKAKVDGFYATDDSAMVERIGIPVYLVLGSEENYKITTPQDFMRAEENLRWIKS